MIKKLIKWLFITKDGKVVIGQFPNIPIIIWLVSLIINYLVNNDKISLVVSLVGTLSLVYWAILEITKGVNGLRRLLGLVILLYVISQIVTKLWQ
jgi:hypothetical protein